MVGSRNQRIMGGSTTVVTKQKFFLVDGIYRNDNPGCLLDLLEYLGDPGGWRTNGTRATDDTRYNIFANAMIGRRFQRDFLCSKNYRKHAQASLCTLM
ncbi:hypothetical protein TNCV_3656921 [Trichonephila clavipes]|nr:hypothetical protein TNCV_3656921 [Trichonephila clavipes]